MKKFVVAVIMVALVLVATPAQAVSHYGESARSVANNIGCEYAFRVRTAPHANSSVECVVPNTKFVYVITFDSKAKQKAWTRIIKRVEGRNFYWATGKGAVVVPEHGSKAVAKTAARMLDGGMSHG